MKKRIVLLSSLLLIVLAGGISLAWLIKSEARSGEFQLGTVELELIEDGFRNIEPAELGDYDKKIKVKSLGSEKAYARVRLLPEWSEPSLPISNIVLNLAANDDWVYLDGHYYYKYYLREGEESNYLIEGISIVSLDPEYEGQKLTLQVVAEAAQISHGAWKHIWGIDNLPFTPEEAFRDKGSGEEKSR